MEVIILQKKKNSTLRMVSDIEKLTKD